jgi:hypothetical protein
MKCGSLLTFGLAQGEASWAALRVDKCSPRRQSVFSLVAMLENVPIDGWFPAKPLGRPNRRDLVAPDPIDGRCGP